MPKIVDIKLMQEKIMKASMDILLKNGVHNMTMDLVAKKVNIAKGTLYLYFTSKQNLISAITTQHYTELKKTLISKELFKTLDEFLVHIKGNLLIDRKKAQFIRIFFDAYGSKLSSEEFREEYHLFFQDIADFYRKNFDLLIENEQIDKNIHTTTFSRALVSLIDGMILHRGFFKIPDDSYAIMVEDTIKMFQLMLCRK